MKMIKKPKFTDGLIPNQTKIKGFGIHKLLGMLIFIFTFTTVNAENAPYNGTPIAIPGIIHLEEFDLGGEGVAYSDSTEANQWNKFRIDEGVDIQNVVEGGTDWFIGAIKPGEWLEYTVDVAIAGNYDVAFTYATAEVTNRGWFTLFADDVQIGDSIVVPYTGHYRTMWQTDTVSGFTLEAGEQIIRVYMDTLWYNLKEIEFIAVNTPYNGTPIAIPGIIHLEEFDFGGEGVAYADSTVANQWNKFRIDEGVDIQNVVEGGTDWFIGAIKPGEWLEYTVDVAIAGNYDVAFTYATAEVTNRGWFTLFADGVQIGDSIVVPYTGHYRTMWQTDTVSGYTLEAGEQIIRIYMNTLWYNLKEIEFIAVNTPYNGTPIAIPGIIHLEEFDFGGEGVAYADSTAHNHWPKFRITEGVDIQNVAEGGTDWFIGAIKPGEWLEYTVDVAEAGNYDVAFTYATAEVTNRGWFTLFADGVQIGDSIVVPYTGHYRTIWKTDTLSGYTLEAGEQIIRVYMNTLWYNLKEIEFIISGSIPTTYTLTVTPNGNGAISVSPDKEAYDEGETVTLTATPDAGNKFDNWSGDATGTSTTTTVTMNSNKTVTANFSVITFTLATVINGNGTVVANPQKDVYNDGETVTLTATPNAGNKFDNWSGDATGTSTTTTITMTSDMSVTANFSLITSVNLSSAIENSIKLYPNPVSNGWFIIENLAENSRVTIVDLAGKTVIQKVSSGKEFNKFDITSLNSGFYMVSISSGNQIKTLKLVVK